MYSAALLVRHEEEERVGLLASYRTVRRREFYLRTAMCRENLGHRVRQSSGNGVRRHYPDCAPSSTSTSR